MNGKGIWVLFLILIILANLYYYEEKKQKQIQMEKEEEKTIFKIDPQSLVGLELKSLNQKPIKITKNGNWRITSPVNTNVDSIELEKYLSILKNLRSMNVLSNTDSDLSQFGLDNPVFSLTVVSKNKAETLLIGSETPVRSEYYAMKLGEKKVFTLNDHDVKNLQKDLFMMRSKRLVEVSPEDVQELFIKANGLQCALKKRNGGWEGIQDVDQLKVDALLGRLIWTQATGVIKEEKDDLKGLSLENPQWNFVLKCKDKTVSISFSSVKVDSEEVLYATSDQISHVFIMPNWLKNHLPNSPSDLRKPESK